MMILIHDFFNIIKYYYKYNFITYFYEILLKSFTIYKNTMDNNDFQEYYYYTVVLYVLNLDMYMY